MQENYAKISPIENEIGTALIELSFTPLEKLRNYKKFIALKVLKNESLEPLDDWPNNKCDEDGFLVIDSDNISAKKRLLYIKVNETFVEALTLNQAPRYNLTLRVGSNDNEINVSLIVDDNLYTKFSDDLKEIKKRGAQRADTSNLQKEQEERALAEEKERLEREAELQALKEKAQRENELQEARERALNEAKLKEQQELERRKKEEQEARDKAELDKASLKEEANLKAQELSNKNVNATSDNNTLNNEEKNKEKKSKLPLILLALLLLLIILAILYFMFFKDKDKSTEPPQEEVVATCSLDSENIKDIMDNCNYKKGADNSELVNMAISNAKESNNCDKASRILMSIGRTGDINAALALANFYNENTDSNSKCFVKNKEDAIYWYEKVLEQDANNQDALSSLRALRGE